jgi:hypothetical protein
MKRWISLVSVALGFLFLSTSVTIAADYMDIKAGSCPNSFNLKKKGVLPIALGSDGEDMEVLVDPALSDFIETLVLEVVVGGCGGTVVESVDVDDVLRSAVYMDHAMPMVNEDPDHCCVQGEYYPVGYDFDGNPDTIECEELNQACSDLGYDISQGVAVYDTFVDLILALDAQDLIEDLNLCQFERGDEVSLCLKSIVDTVEVFAFEDCLTIIKTCRNNAQ